MGLLTLVGCATTTTKPTPSELAGLLSESNLEVSLDTMSGNVQGNSDEVPGRSANDAPAVKLTSGRTPSSLSRETVVASEASPLHMPTSGGNTSLASIETSLRPFSIRESRGEHWSAPEPWDLSVDELIQLALANGTVLRTLGARVIQSPDATSTIYEPALALTDPTEGVEAALSEFDARLRGDLFFEDNDRVLNSEFAGQGENFFKQYLTRYESSLSKQSASGTTYTLRHNFEADNNNSDRNLINDRAWAWNFEGEVRQPLLQGRSVAFNRIAGPNASPGIYNGVVIARLNADITVADLEIALRDFLSDVENAYWDLHFAYKDLQVKKDARDRTLQTYQLLKARQGLPGAEEDKLAQALEQYYRFEQEVQNSLAGRLVVGTRSFNGSGGGTFQGAGGVYVAERRLRMIAGLPINDGRLIRTTTEPSLVPITYDWSNVASNAICRRTELKRQRLNVSMRRQELLASRNFLLPRLDAIGRYRYRALGDSWLGREIVDNGSLIETDTHELLVGVSVDYPIGLRQASAAVRHAQLQLAREQSMLNELERQVVYGVSNAITEIDRAYVVLQSALNRENAARKQYEILVSESQTPIRQFNYNALLDAEQRFAEASSAANRARIQYALATKNINFEMGSLLAYYNIHLAGQSRIKPKKPSRRRLRTLLGKSWNHAVSHVPIQRPGGRQSTDSAIEVVSEPVVDPIESFDDQIAEIIDQELSSTR